MTIKEAEARTGLARANIRYYEDQGFFTAARGENGYRNYTGADIDLLLKIRLLRQLGFSLEEIHDLQRGDRELAPALGDRIAGLEKERREMVRAADLCRELREDGVSFPGLNAQLYLDRLMQEEEFLKTDREPVRVFHWRRFFARSFDRMIWELLLALVTPYSMGLRLMQLEGNRTGNVIWGCLVLVLMGGSETCFLHCFGRTPGKALLGLKVVREDGSLLGWGEAARRTASVTAILLALQLTLVFPIPPVFVYVGYAWMYWTVTHELPLPWEREGHLYLEGSTRQTPFWQRKDSRVRAAAYVLAVAAAVGLLGSAERQAALPPNRGPELTVEEFVENYNFCDRMERGSAALPLSLQQDGTFFYAPVRRNQRDWRLDWADSARVPLPALEFEEKDGVVTAVTISRAGESTEPLAQDTFCQEIIPYTHFRVALLALGVDPEDAELLWMELVAAGGNLEYTLPDWRVVCGAQFSGYKSWNDTRTREDSLWGIVGETQSYRVEFTVSRTGEDQNPG